MKITVIGTGYVGLVNGACLSEIGHYVTCVDINQEKIDELKNGFVSIYEPGLSDIVIRNINNGRLTFTTSYNSIKNSDIVFIAVGTPTKDGGKGVDMSFIQTSVKEVVKNIENDVIIVMKSTVPVGTSKSVKEYVNRYLNENNKNHEIWFDVISNPEFLKEGDAVNDFFNPDRIIIGAENEKTIYIMKKLYGDNILVTKTESSEMIKYASNAMLATRISFMNELSSLCEFYGANIEEVKQGMGLDSRIGNKFLNAGCGYGGSCFPKDVDGLLMMAENMGVELNIVKSVEIANERQKHIILKKLQSINEYENISNKTISILGLSFKPNTDDMREAPSLTIIKDIKENFDNIKLKVYDPIAIENCKKILKDDTIYYSNCLNDCLNNSNIVILVTEWDEFKNIKWGNFKNISVVIDGRNFFNSDEIINNGIKYMKIG